MTSGFHAVRTGQLRRAGFEGDFVWAGMRDGAFELIGERAGFLRIVAAQIERLRAGKVQGRYRTVYQCAILLRGGGPPIYLHPLPEYEALYAATVRGLAAAVLAQAGLARIERGTTVADAVLAPLLMAVPALGAVAVAAFIVTDAEWWQRLLIPAIPVALLALLAWSTLGRQMPRRIDDLTELDRELPPA